MTEKPKEENPFRFIFIVSEKCSFPAKNGRIKQIYSSIFSLYVLSNNFTQEFQTFSKKNAERWLEQVQVIIIKCFLAVKEMLIGLENQFKR